MFRKIKENKRTVSLAIVILFLINSVSYSSPIQPQQDTLRAAATSLTTASDIQQALDEPRVETETVLNTTVIPRPPADKVSHRISDFKVPKGSSASSIARVVIAAATLAMLLGACDQMYHDTEVDNRGTSPASVSRSVNPLDFDLLSGDEQWISERSLLAVTLIASHMEHISPDGLPRQTLEQKPSRRDPVDFIHIKNISRETVNLSDYLISDGEQESTLVKIRDLVHGEDIFLMPNQEIRIIFSTMIKEVEELSRVMIIVPINLDRKGDGVMVFTNDYSLSPVLAAKNARHKQDEVTIFREGNLLTGQTVKLKSGDILNRVSHNISDFSAPKGSISDSIAEVAVVAATFPFEDRTQMHYGKNTNSKAQFQEHEYEKETKAFKKASAGSAERLIVFLQGENKVVHYIKQAA
jgi:hypothetical protein